jgi:hypothetical protein
VTSPAFGTFCPALVKSWHKECLSFSDRTARADLFGAPSGGCIVKHLVSARIYLPAIYLLVGTLLIAG